MEGVLVMRQASSNKLLKRIFYHWQLYAMLVIPIVYIIIFAYWPMYGAQIAFRQFMPRLGIWDSPWVGMDNFMRFFNSHQFRRVIVNTFVLSAYGLVAGFPLPIILALGLNVIQRKYFRKTVQMVTYIPHFISVVVIVGMIFQLFNPILGIYGNAWRALFDTRPPNLLGSPSAFRHIFVWSGIWQGVGWGSIIYFAALSGIDVQLHEAAIADGASRFKRIIHIDIPGIMPTAVILLILSCGNIMSVGFEKVFLMQNELNRSASEVISTYTYRVAFVGGTDFSLASAVGLFNSVVGLVLIIIVNTIAKRVGETSLW